MIYMLNSLDFSIFRMFQGFSSTSYFKWFVYLFQAYIDNDSNKKSFLQAALDSVEDIQKVDSG